MRWRSSGSHGAAKSQQKLQTELIKEKNIFKKVVQITALCWDGEELRVHAPPSWLPSLLMLHSAFMFVTMGVSCQGAGRVLCDSGKHPAQLRAEVCTPGGTTIYGLHSLEQGGVRAATMSAVEAATERARELGRSSSTCTK